MSQMPKKTNEEPQKRESKRLSGRVGESSEMNKQQVPRKKGSQLQTQKRSSKIMLEDLKNPFPKDKNKKTIEKIHTEKEYTFIPNLTQEIEFSYKEDQNKKYKIAMEDKGKSIINYLENQKYYLFTWFDGHGGDFVSIYLQNYFDKYLKKNLTKFTEEEIKNSITKTFLEIDNAIKEKSLHVGSTGTIVLIIEEKNNILIYGGNVGDSRCTLFNEKNFERLSFDHRVEDKKEKEKIINSGGMIEEGRVNGQLMLTRVFGDFDMKKSGVKCEPYLFSKVIEKNITNQFLIIASDGIWDIIDEWEIKDYIFDICRDYEGSGESVTKHICDKLVDDALQSGSWDNISCFAIRLC